MFCPQCGTQVPDDMQFCPSCGTVFGAQNAPAETEEDQWKTVPLASAFSDPSAQAPAYPDAQAPAYDVPPVQEPYYAQEPQQPYYAQEPYYAQQPGMQPEPPAKPKSHKGLIIGLVAGVVVLALLIAGVILVVRHITSKHREATPEPSVVAEETTVAEIIEETTAADDTEARILAEYEKNPKLYQLTDLRLFGLDRSDEAVAQIKEMYDKITDEDSFIALAEEYASEEDKEAYKEETATLAKGVKYTAVRDNIDKDTAEWLFADSRRPGDKNIAETDSMVFVFYVVKTAYRQEDPLVDVRHILVSYESIAEEMGAAAYSDEIETAAASDGVLLTNDGSGGYSMAAELAAYEKAKNIMNEYLGGEQTAEAFALLADKYSDDTYSTTGGGEGGGLYTGIERGQMVDTFDEWIYDSVRKPGDVELVWTTYGWHVMYFVQRHAEPAWKEAVMNQLENE